MRHTRLIWIVLSCTSLTCLAGCVSAVQHNDVLLFGVDTKLALDVSASAAQGGVPEITIGYNRTEAVWMPLVVNGRGVDGVGVAALCNTAGSGARTGCPAGLGGAKYLGGGEASATHPGGGQDAYSVFASFGAKISGRADTPNGVAEGGVGLAQFFATGIAAQRLASAQRVEQLVSLQSPAATEAAARAAAPERLTDAQILDIARLIEARQARAGVADKAAACVTLRGGTAFSPDQFPESSKLGSFADRLRAASTREQFAHLIELYPQSVDEFGKAVAATCTTGG